MEGARINGEYNCPVHPSWSEFLPKAEGALKDLDRVQSAMTSINENTARITSTLDSMNNNLLNAAVGKDHIPMKVAMRMMNTLIVISVGLLFVIGTLLTGEHFGFIRTLFK